MRGDRELPLILGLVRGWRSRGRVSLLLFTCVTAGCGEPPPIEERSLRGGDFVCVEGTCTQRELALPDDGDWECMDQSGLVVCRGGHVAAGVAAGPSDDAFVCAPLARDEQGRRVCVDANPDRPTVEGWACRHERDHEGPFADVDVRRCTRDDSTRLGDRCDHESCPVGLACRDDRCALVDDAPPDCWLDSDCEGGSTCVLARCSLSH